MNIKGENLRVFLTNTKKVVAASTNATLHIAAQVENLNTKDTTSAWDENEIVSLNWDVAVDALVVDETTATDKNTKTYDAENATVEEADDHSYAILDVINLGNLPLGSTLGVNLIDIDTHEEGTLCVIGSDDETLADYEVLGSGDNIELDDFGEWAYVLITLKDPTQPQGSYAKVETVISSPNAADADYLMNLMTSMDSVVLEFSVAQGASNRVAGTKLFRGNAKVTDISINANNREKSTFRTQFTGIAEPTYPVVS